MARPWVKINVKRCKRLKQIIDETKITQYHLAELTNISPQSISNMVRCKANVTEKTARAVVEVFPQYNFEWLMGHSEYKTELEQRLSPKIFAIVSKKKREKAVNGFFEAHGLSFTRYLPGIPPDMPGDIFAELPPAEQQMHIKRAMSNMQYYLIETKSQKTIAVISKQEYENFVADINDYVEFKFDKLFKDKGEN